MSVLDNLGADVRSALRALGRARGFTAVAVATLGIGLALCLTVFTIANAYLVRALPYPAADRLYAVQYGPPGGATPPDLERLDWSSLDAIVEHPLAWDLDMFYLLGGDFPEPQPGAWVAPGFAEAFGVRAIRGRGLVPDDFAAGSPLVVLISHRLWQTRFAGDPGVIGRRLDAYVSDRPDEAETFTIVGVLPSDFWHLNPYTEVLAPLKVATYPYIVQLRPTVPPDVAAARMTTLVSATQRTLPPGWSVQLTPVRTQYTAVIRPVILAISTASVLVLLIACANVAVLLLVRGAARRQEIAVRLALGASRRRIARLAAIDAAIIGAVSTAVGLAGSALLLRWLAPLVERHLERRVPGGEQAFALDTTAVALAVACGLVLSAVMTVIPLLSAWSPRLSPSLAGRRTATDDPRLRRTRSILIALEVAASLTLLMGSALMVQTAARMLRVDFGIDVTRVVSMGTALRQRAYPDVVSRAALFDRLLTHVAAGADGAPVALGDTWLFQEPRPRAVHAEVPDGRQSVESAVLAIAGDYFGVLQIPLLDGRAFTASDRHGAEPVALVSRTLAERLWPQGRAVGQRVHIAASEGETQEQSYAIVGVVSDVRQTHTDTRLFDVYVPLLQRPGRFVQILTRTSEPMPLVERAQRATIATVDPEIAVQPPRRLDSVLDELRARPRVLAMLLSGFAAFSGVLALIGLYGVIAYAARQRQREIAVRMAIGASRASVVRLFVRQGMLVLIVGLACGLLGAFGAGRVLAGQLHGVAPSDLPTLVAVTVALLLGGVAAIWWPARRAAATDPAMVLKDE